MAVIKGDTRSLDYSSHGLSASQAHISPDKVQYLEVHCTYNLLSNCSYNLIISRVTIIMGLIFRL